MKHNHDCEDHCHSNTPSDQAGLANHNHHHHVKIDNNRGKHLLFVLALNFIIPVVQIGGGIFAHSVALISDAIHNFSDFTAILIAYIAYKIAKRGASIHNTFGYSRAEILATLINVAMLIGASGVILYEAIIRFRNPEPVQGIIVMTAATIGILGNGLSAWVLHKDSEHNLNARGAFLHMMGDMLTSVAVLFNGFILLFKEWYWIDPLLSLVIVIFILKNCWVILKEAGLILMNATPKEIDITKIKRSIESIPQVCGVHYLHAWQQSSSSIAFSAHIVVHDQLVSQTEALAKVIRDNLMNNFKIDHPILQFETSPCGNGTMLCEISCAGEYELDRTI
ncbi:MAG: cation transporter [Desulfamplus sp.]|nr:cation transporter [Desulfamplus sp.]